jgi:hypothetical protein
MLESGKLGGDMSDEIGNAIAEVQRQKHQQRQDAEERLRQGPPQAQSLAAKIEAEIKGSLKELLPAPPIPVTDIKTDASVCNFVLGDNRGFNVSFRIVVPFWGSGSQVSVKAIYNGRKKEINLPTGEIDFELLKQRILAAARELA